MTRICDDYARKKDTRWQVIDGYKYIYRVSDQGDVQKRLPSGSWKTLKPYFYSGQLRVHLWLPDGSWKRVQVSKIVADAFLGGTPSGMLRVHKNGVKSDNAAENIIFLTRAEAAKRHRPGNSRPVLKVDRRGKVVEVYRSQVEAARKNHISQQAISKRCNGLIEDPYRLDGYNYVFEEKIGRPKKQKIKKEDDT